MFRRFASRRPLLAAMLTTILLVVLPSQLVLTGAGCQAIKKVFNPEPVAPGEDAIAVNAERTVRSAYVLADTFMALEDANRAAITQAAPAIHQAAEQLRREAPPMFRKAWATVQAYKKATAPTGGVPPGASDVERELATVEGLAKRVRELLTQVNGLGLDLTQPPPSEPPPLGDE